MEKTELLKKRSSNVYDTYGLISGQHHIIYTKIDESMQQSYTDINKMKGLTGRNKPFIPLKEAKQNSFYTEQIKVYWDKQL